MGSYFRLRLGNRRSGSEGGGRSFKKRKEIPCLLAISPRQRRGARAFNEVGDIYARFQMCSLSEWVCLLLEGTAPNHNRDRYRYRYVGGPRSGYLASMGMLGHESTGGCPEQSWALGSRRWRWWGSQPFPSQARDRWRGGEGPIGHLSRSEHSTVTL